MKRPRSTLNLVLLLLATSVPVMLIGWRFIVQSEGPTPEHAVAIKLQIDGGKERVDLKQNADGSYSYIIEHAGGSQPEVFTPNELADRLYRQQSSRNWLSKLFNISSPIGFIWVSIGLLGQVLFTGRMVIQWLASEKNRRSIVPPMFWWMSLLGAVMLLTYFLWRRDIVGVLGQSFGLIIYIRNLYFIYGTSEAGAASRVVSAAADPAPEPELAETT